jgi:hypothetical protein
VSHVCLSVYLTCHQLFAAIEEWLTGKHIGVDFTSNAFADVYNGHVNTFNHIREGREDAFHVMMADIYSQAV